MRISYDERTDTLSLVLKEGAGVAVSDEGKPGVILDYDEKGELVSAWHVFLMLNRPHIPFWVLYPPFELRIIWPPSI